MTSYLDIIVENFPYPTFTSIAGIPDFESISELHTQENSNSSSIQSNLGDIAYGLLTITLESVVLNTNDSPVYHSS